MTDVRPPVMPEGFFGPGALGGTRSTTTRRTSAADPTARPSRRQGPTARARPGRAPRRGPRARPAPRRHPDGHGARRPNARRPPAARRRATGRRAAAHRPEGRGTASPSSHRQRPKWVGRFVALDGVVRRRYVVLGVVFSIMLLLAVAKLTDLQVLSPSRYRATGDEQRMTSVTLQAARGGILDRNGRDLAVSVPRSTVVVDPTQVSDVRAEAARLAPILGKKPATIEGLLRKKSRFVYLDRLVSDATAAKISKLADAGKLDGVDLISEYQRVRPAGDEAQAVLGSTDIDGTGISGLEKQYDTRMLGKPGKVSYEQSAMGPIAGAGATSPRRRPGTTWC